MITFIQTIILFSQLPPAPSGTNNAPPPPGAPIDNGLIFLFCIGIVFGSYMHYKKIQHKKKSILKTL